MTRKVLLAAAAVALSILELRRMVFYLLSPIQARAQTEGSMLREPNCQGLSKQTLYRLGFRV